MIDLREGLRVLGNDSRQQHCQHVCKNGLTWMPLEGPPGPMKDTAGAQDETTHLVIRLMI